MKKLDLGQAVSILANIGVITGIVFLALQLRQNNEWLASESRYYHSVARQAWHETLATDEQLVAILEKARESERLSFAEQTQLMHLYGYLFTQWEWEHRQDELGRTEVSIEGYRSAFDIDSATGLPILPGIHDAWGMWKSTYSEDFQTFMDESIVH